MKNFNHTIIFEKEDDEAIENITDAAKVIIESQIIISK